MLERNKKKLHRVASHHSSDWQDLALDQMNRWQRAANATGGVATIANTLTVVGFLLVIGGLFQLADGNYPQAILLIGFGRLLDYVDGISADMTRTKSRLGASFDEVADAIGLGACLIAFVIYDTMPVILLMCIAIPKTLNALSWCIAKLRHIRMDTTAQSKVATFIIWSGLLFYLLFHATDTPFDGVFYVAGWGLSIFGAGLSTPSSYNYVRYALRRR